jgi:hypothetical protein
MGWHFLFEMVGNVFHHIVLEPLYSLLNSGFSEYNVTLLYILLTSLGAMKIRSFNNYYYFIMKFLNHVYTSIKTY